MPRWTRSLGRPRHPSAAPRAGQQLLSHERRRTLLEDARPRVRTQTSSGSALSGSMPSSAIADATRSGGTVPASASARIAASAIDGASISKCARSASRVSLRPNPSVPSATNGAATHRETWSGTTFIQSVAAMTGPPSGPRTEATYGTRCSAAGWSRFQRSVTIASRLSCWNDGALYTSAATPNRSASSACAAVTCVRIEPLPTRRTRAAPAPRSGAGDRR